MPEQTLVSFDMPRTGYHLLRRSISSTEILCVGPAQQRSLAGLDAHKLDSSFAVLTVDFRVMQKIMMGFFCVCLAIMPGSLNHINY